MIVKSFSVEKSSIFRVNDKLKIFFSRFLSISFIEFV